MTATLTASAVRIEGIRKSFADVEVLRGVDLDIAPGSVFALLGSNGAGKTTLVRILSTLLRADAGTASVQGFDVADRPGDVRRLLVDNTLVRELTGFAPRTGFEQGVADLVDWFRTRPESPEEMLSRIEDRNWVAPEAAPAGVTS